MPPRNTHRSSKPTPTHHCGECAHSYDHHDRAAHGGFILCRCPHYREGRFCRLIKEKACALFRPRPAYAPTP